MLRHNLATNPGRRYRGTPHILFRVSWHAFITFVAPHSVTAIATATTNGSPAIGFTLFFMSSPTNGSCDHTASRMRLSKVGLSSKTIVITVTNTNSSGVNAKKP